MKDYCHLFFQKNRVVQIIIPNYQLMKSFLSSHQADKKTVFVSLLSSTKIIHSPGLNLKKIHMEYYHLKAHGLGFFLYISFIIIILVQHSCLSFYIHLLIHLIIMNHHPLSIVFSCQYEQKIKFLNSKLNSVKVKRRLQILSPGVFHLFLKDNDAILLSPQNEKDDALVIFFFTISSFFHMNLQTFSY